MQNATRKVFQTKEMAGGQTKGSSPVAWSQKMSASSTKNLAIVLAWFTVLGCWLDWSVSNDQYLLFETIPAAIVITLVLMLRAMGEQH